MTMLAPDKTALAPVPVKETDFRPHMTMDTSALIHLANGPTRGRKYIDIIHFLKHERNAQVSFPDQVVFEFTGLLPQTQQWLLIDNEKRGENPLTSSLSHNVQSSRENLIRAATANSPRISTRQGPIAGRYERNRSFLSLFLPETPGEDAPVALVSTSIGRQFNDRAVSELEMAAGSSRHAEQYSLSFEDALKLAPDYFDYRKLQLTWKAAHNLGWFPTEELKRQLNHSRHITAEKTQEYLQLDDAHPLLKRQKKKQDSPADSYLLLGDLIDHKLLTPEAVEGVGRVWKLTLGDMFHSGLLPKQDLVAVAFAIGFPTPASGKLTLKAAQEQGVLAEHWEDKLKAYCKRHPSHEQEAVCRRFMQDGVEAAELADMGLFAPQKTWDYFKEKLSGTGFFEHHVTLQDAQRIASADAHSIPLRYPAMGTLSSASALARTHQAEFIARCRDLLPYEKVFSDALINGTITPEEFLRIGQQSGALFSEDGKYITSDKAVAIQFNPFQPERSRVSVAPEGIHSRVFGEQTTAQLVLADWRNRNPLKNESPLKTASLGELLTAAKQSIFENRGRDTMKYHRLFDTVLTPAVMKDAFHVREMARDVLGDVRLQQMEFDFANKHFRVLVKRMGRKPYETPYTSLHANSRSDQWDLGELSILESVLSSEHRNNIVLNTDHELSQTLASRIVDEELIRKKPDYRTPIEESVRKLRQHPAASRLTNLNVQQFMDKLEHVIRRSSPEQHEELSDKYSFVSMMDQRASDADSLHGEAQDDERSATSRRKWKTIIAYEKAPLNAQRSPHRERV